MKNEESKPLFLSYAMPFGERLECRPSKPINELEVGIDEEIEGVVYELYWNDKCLPISVKTRLQAILAAFSCQWGAFETLRRRNQ